MSDLIRLQKYLSRCGVASRRHSEKLISNGCVSVNGVVTTKLGTKIDSSQDSVCVNDEPVSLSNHNITLMLNKPAGFVNTMNDPQGRPCVADLVPCAEYPNLFPIGRLDRLTCGLLLFTTNGELGNTLMHPKNNINKTYVAIVKGRLSNKDIQFIESGAGVYRPAKLKLLEEFDYSKFVIYEDKFFENAAVVSPFKPQNLMNEEFSMFLITIHEGKNRQIRKMFSSCVHEVLLLKRQSIGNIKLNNLEIGKWRKITKGEMLEIKDMYE